MVLIGHNINSYVRVKLKKEGIEIMKKRYARVGMTYEHNPDKDGYSSFQMHNFMLIFGPHCMLGYEAPFDTRILIDISEEEMEEFLQDEKIRRNICSNKSGDW